MKRFILTGTPGSGKTSLIRSLELKNYCVVEESATDIISIEQLLGNTEPWRHESFIDKIIYLQKQRQLFASDIRKTKIQFFDRSPICTYALAKYLNFKHSKVLLDEIQRIEKENIYHKQVFFIENLGFIEQTNARKISFNEALEFEELHKNIYRDFNYEIINIKPNKIENRCDEIIKMTGSF